MRIVLPVVSGVRSILYKLMTHLSGENLAPRRFERLGL